MKKIFTSFFVLGIYLSSLNINAQVCYGVSYNSLILGPAYSPVVVLNGDYNKDGNMDLIVNDRVNLRVYLGNSTGSFTPGISVPVIGMYDMATADYNSDGNIDVVDNYSNTIEMFYGNGSGNFSIVNYTISTSSGDAIETADFNNDLNMDILVATVPGFDILLGNGLGTFSLISVTHAGTKNDFTCGDFNNDGNVDIASM